MQWTTKNVSPPTVRSSACAQYYGSITEDDFIFSEFCVSFCEFMDFACLWKKSRDRFAIVRKGHSEVKVSVCVCVCMKKSDDFTYLF